MKVRGYMVVVSYEDGVLTAHTTNKMTRFAMAGELTVPDAEKVNTQSDVEPDAEAGVEPEEPDAADPQLVYTVGLSDVSDEAPDQARERSHEEAEQARERAHEVVEQARRQAHAQTQELHMEFHQAMNEDLVLRQDQIASVQLKDATPFTNGRLTITETSGTHHVLHFRRKQRDGFHALAEALHAEAP
jgi:hypothetical protein